MYKHNYNYHSKEDCNYDPPDNGDFGLFMLLFVLACACLLGWCMSSCKSKNVLIKEEVTERIDSLCTVEENTEIALTSVSDKYVDFSSENEIYFERYIYGDADSCGQQPLLMKEVLNISNKQKTITQQRDSSHYCQTETANSECIVSKSSKTEKKKRKEESNSYSTFLAILGVLVLVSYIVIWLTWKKGKFRQC